MGRKGRLRAALPPSSAPFPPPGWSRPPLRQASVSPGPPGSREGREQDPGQGTLSWTLPQPLAAPRARAQWGGWKGSGFAEILKGPLWLENCGDLGMPVRHGCVSCQALGPCEGTFPTLPLLVFPDSCLGLWSCSVKARPWEDARVAH